MSMQFKRPLRNGPETNVEVLIYGDGAYCDPVGRIWELADPVVGAGLYLRVWREYRMK